MIAASKPRSLYQRVVIAFGLSAFVLATVFGGAVVGGIYIAEDLMVERSLELELEQFLIRRATDPGEPLPSNRWLGSTLDVAELPELLRLKADAPDGIHEFAESPLRQFPRRQSQAQGEYMLLIHTLAEGERLYLYLDASKVEVFEGFEGVAYTTLVAVVVAVTALGVLLGRMTARRVLAPVIELADRVRNLDQRGSGGEAPSLSDGFAADEVGLLARAFEASEARSRAFLERERRFTRDASHELRSPVTIVRGAVELLETRPEVAAPGIARPLARIRRAADEMSGLIEAFLWLAREEALSEDMLDIQLAPEVTGAVERYSHLIDGKPVDVSTSVDAEAVVPAPKGVLGIVIGNLVANAFAYTQEGPITIQADSERLVISDSGSGIPASRRQEVLEAHRRGQDSAGFGLGLAICHDLCERFDWRLELLEPEGPGPGTRAVVHFR